MSYGPDDITWLISLSGNTIKDQREQTELSDLLSDDGWECSSAGFHKVKAQLP